MSITILAKDYVQKSRMFLYPALDIRRGVSIIPIETYASWSGQYTEHDMKYSCLYHLRGDKEFRMFEKDKLFGNKLFNDFKQVEDNKGVYVFDFSSYKHDWRQFILGRYSKMSDSYKKKIKSFYGSTSPNYPYIESFLHPEKYFNLYAHLMRVDKKILEEVGELCDKPNIDSETLRIDVKSLQTKSEIS